MKMTLHILPIEPIEQRYSADWYRIWPQEMMRLGHNVEVYDGQRLPEYDERASIKTGEFLDVFDTHAYKASQLRNVVSSLKAGRIKAGDVVLLLDGWSPSVTSLAYMRDASGIQFKIVLLLHAGTWDAYDFLSRCGMSKWASHVEVGWMMACDRIFVATNFHKKLILNFASRHRVDSDVERKIDVTGFPLPLNELDIHKMAESEKENWVIFPHRLAPEKQPDVFRQMEITFRKMYPAIDCRWLMTQEIADVKEGGKAEYYRLLSKGKVAVSTALQETWGIAQLESWWLGCNPIVPRRLSYCELYPENCFYNDMEDACRLIADGLLSAQRIPFNPTRNPMDAFRTISERIFSMNEEDVQCSQSKRKWKWPVLIA